MDKEAGCGGVQRGGVDNYCADLSIQKLAIYGDRTDSRLVLQRVLYKRSILYTSIKLANYPILLPNKSKRYINTCGPMKEECAV
jgi:hypothetical protein